MMTFDKDLWKDCVRKAIADAIEAGKDPKACSQCQGALVGKDDRDRGVCNTCEVASWSPEKKKAIGRMIGLAFRKSNGEPIPQADIDLAIDKAFEHDK